MLYYLRDYVSLKPSSLITHGIFKECSKHCKPKKDIDASLIDI